MLTDPNVNPNLNHTAAYYTVQICTQGLRVNKYCTMHTVQVAQRAFCPRAQSERILIHSTSAELFPVLLSCAVG